MGTELLPLDPLSLSHGSRQNQDQQEDHGGRGNRAVQADAQQNCGLRDSPDEAYSAGPLRGISLKLQEEERERRMDFEPDVSAVDVENIEVDPDTQAMLRSLDMPNLMTDIKVTTSYGRHDRRDDR